MSLARVASVLVLLVGGVVLATPPPACRADDAPEKCAPDPNVEAAKLEEEVSRLFAEGKYAEAAEKCRAEIALLPKSPGARYNLACALARLGKADEALAALETAAELGYDDATHMKADPDLAALRDTKRFAEIVALVAANDAKAALGTDDRGFDMPTLRSVVGAPEGGLAWRMLLSPTADATKPQRLLVWLHPSGGSMNGTIGQLALRWTAAGFAVLFPTHKRWSGWTADELARLFGPTLADAAKTVGVDAKRPVLAGFSAGGQAALSMWRAEPSRFGGLLLDAAYPLDPEKYAKRQVEPFALPAGDAVKSVPILVLVGEADGGHRVWKQVEAGWREAGVPLIVEYVPGGRHEWLLHVEQFPLVDAWLRDVAAGKTPTARRAPPASPVAPAPAAPAVPVPAPAK